jgi:adenylate kinase
MKIVLMGMPGVGKGTQAARLKDALDVPHVSTGDILREAVREGSALGRKVQRFLDSGELVPDEVMGDLIAERLARPDARGGFILDGFPRTREQVAILDDVLQRVGISLDAVFLLAAPEDEIVRRLSGRRVCPNCAAVYHLENGPPTSAGVCDACSSALVQRPDDTESVIRDRLKVYADQTLPVADVYRERGQLRELDASGDPDTVFDALNAAVATP